MPRAAFSHASAVVIGESGVLIRGASGASKSALALALIEAARRAGAFAALVGDDRIALSPAHERLIARGHPSIAGRIERRGIGVLTVEALPAAVVRLLIDLVPPAEAPRLPDGPDDHRLDHDGWDFSGLPRVAIEGIELPLLRLPAGAPSCELAAAILLRLRSAHPPPRVQHF